MDGHSNFPMSPSLKRETLYSNFSLHLGYCFNKRASAIVRKNWGIILKGNILSFGKATNKGKISGFDGARYEFVKQDANGQEMT